MTKKYIIIGLTVLAVAFLASLFFYARDIKNPKSETGNNEMKNEPSVLVVIDEKSYWEELSVQTYSVGNFQFKIYPKKDDGINFSSGWFQIYDGQKEIFSTQPDESDTVSGLLHFLFGENQYVVVKSYSGGAHCCDTDYIFRINGNNELKLIKTWELGNATIFKDSLVVKNEKLYFAISDDRFSYFHVPYSGSYFFTQYYQLDGDNITLANGDFKDEFLKNVVACQENLNKDLKAPKNEYYFETWFADLLCYVTSHMLAGNKETALGGFDDYFAKFAYGKTVTDSFNEKLDRETVKQEIIETLDLSPNKDSYEN